MRSNGFNGIDADLVISAERMLRITRKAWFESSKRQSRRAVAGTTDEHNSAFVCVTGDAVAEVQSDAYQQASGYQQ